MYISKLLATAMVATLGALGNTGLIQPQQTTTLPEAVTANPATPVTDPQASAQAMKVKSKGGALTLDVDNKVTGAQAEDKAAKGVAKDSLDETPTDADPAVLTQKTDAATFQGLGVTWDKATKEKVKSVNVRLKEGGKWTEWNNLLLIGERVESPSDRTGTDPILTDGATAYQVEVITESGNAPSGLKVTTINPGDGSKDSEVVDLAQEVADTPSGVRSAAMVNMDGSQVASATLASAKSDAIKPTIVTRASWGADEKVTWDARQNSKLSAMYLHHTASSNDYTKEQAAAQIRSIHYYHAVTLDWGDIGYHFLVDKFGTIYEGARGSITSLPQGAHALGFNTNTIGVSALGNYGDVAPPQAMVDSLSKVFAWKAVEHGLNPTGKTTLTSAGNSKYSAGTQVSTDVILGHYYTNNTGCPGQYLLPKLPEIRTAAARIASSGSTSGTVSGTSTSGTYTVQPGDGWWLISQKTGVSMSTLFSLNGMTINTELHPGMVLKTGKATTTAPAPSTTGTYTVVSGDGWYAISSKTGVPVNTLLSLNEMTLSTELHPGMVLKTKASSSTSTAPAPSTSTFWTPADRLKFTDVTAGVTPRGTYIQWAADAGFAWGYSDGTYRESQNASRIVIARMMHNFAAPTKAYTTSTRDVAAADRDDVGFVLSKSAMSLYSDGTFKGTRGMTRADFAKALSRATGSTVPTANGTNLKDVRLGSKNSGHIEWAYENGLMTANASGYFEPGRAVTRGEVAQALAKLAMNQGERLHLVENDYEINVRKGPGTSYGVIGTVKIDSLVRILETDSTGNWARVKNESFTGWMNTYYLD